MKILKTLSLALLATMLWTACGDDEHTTFIPAPGTGTTGAFILNQGNSYSAIGSTYDYLDLKTNKLSSNIFATTNGQGLGGAVQDGIIYGSRLYLAMYESNLVWVINPKTNKIVKSIITSSPEGITAAGGAVYVTNNDGFVSKIDTTKLEVVSKIEVGPNPVDMEVRDGQLYVAISDGYNYANGYANGKKVAKINLSDFTKSLELPVGLNPTQMTQDGNGNIFVVCMGNYSTIPAKVYKIGKDDRAKEFATATIAEATSDRIYLINAPYGQSATYSVVNTESGKAIASKFGTDKDNLPISPIAISIRKTTGEVFVTSSGTLDATTQYTAPGYVYRYDADGTFAMRYQAGVHPCRVVFN